MISTIAKLTGKLTTSKIKDSETYKKLKREFVEPSSKEFVERYKEAKIEIWYSSRPKQFQEFLDKKQVYEAYQQYFEGKISKVHFENRIKEICREDDIDYETTSKFQCNIINEIGNFDDVFRIVVNRTRSAKEKETMAIIQSMDGKFDELVTVLNNENTCLLEKFEKHPNDLGKVDVIRGLCSSNIKLRAYASYYAGLNRLKESAPLLIQNLEVPNNELILFTLQALGDLRATEGKNRIADFVYHSDKLISCTAIDAFFALVSEALHQEDLGFLVRCLSSSQENLRHKSLNTLYNLQTEGKFDAASIIDHLGKVIGSKDDYAREIAYRMMSQIEGESIRLGFKSVVNNPDENEFVRLACLGGIFLDGDHSFIGQHMLDLDYSNFGKKMRYLQNVASICIHSDNEICRKAVKQYLNEYSEYIGHEIDVSFIPTSNFTPTRVRILPNALSLGKVQKDMMTLQNNSKLKSFINDYTSRNSFASTLPLIVWKAKTSGVAFESISDYLKNYQGFHVIDYRQADSFVVRRHAMDYKIFSKVVIILPASFDPLLSNMLYWIYEKNVINMTHIFPCDEAYTIPEESIVIGLIKSEDYADIGLNTGWNRDRFDRMACPILKF